MVSGTLTAEFLTSVDTMFYEDLAVSRSKLVSHHNEKVKVFSFGHQSLVQDSITEDTVMTSPLHIDQETYDEPEFT